MSSLKKFAIFTSTTNLFKPAMPISIVTNPINKIFFGLETTTCPNAFIRFSVKLALDIARDFNSHFFNDNAAGKKVKLRIKAYKIPILKHIPYPISCLIGAK